jgi:hypothetical protein
MIWSTKIDEAKLGKSGRVPRDVMSSDLMESWRSFHGQHDLWSTAVRYVVGQTVRSKVQEDKVKP